MLTSKIELHAELGCERYTDGCTWPEKIAECAGGGSQLAEAGDRPREGAIGVQAKCSGVGKVIDRGG